MCKLQKIGKILVGVSLIFGMAISSYAAEQPKTLKIGVITTESGIGASWGEQMKRTITLQAEQINAQGGVTVGGKKYPLELIYEDDKYTADGARAAAERLIHVNGVKYILGPIPSAGSVAIAPFIEENKVVWMCFSATEKVLGPQFTYSFKVHAATTLSAPAITKWVEDNRPKIRTMAFINPNDETGKSISKAARAAIKRVGVLSDDYYERGTQDFYPLLTKVLGAKPDAINLGGCDEGSAALIIKQAYEQGYRGIFIHGVTIDTGNLIKIAGKTAANNYFHISPVYDSPLCPPKLKRFHGEYEARFPGKASALSMLIVDMLPTLVAGIQAADSLDSTKVRDALEAMKNIHSYYGDTTWGGKDLYGIAHQLRVPVFITEVNNGKNVVRAVEKPNY